MPPAPDPKREIHREPVLRAAAQWDKEKSLLTVTLPIIHDFDGKLTATSSANEID